MARQSALAYDQDRTMSQPPSSRKRSSASGRSDSTRSDSTRKSRSSYDSNFKQNLIDGGVYSHDRLSKPTNIHEIRDILPEYRASLSPSRFGDAEFESFADLNDRVAGETRVIADVLTIVEGKERHKYHNDRQGSLPPANRGNTLGGSDARIHHQSVSSAHVLHDPTSTGTYTEARWRGAL